MKNEFSEKQNTNLRFFIGDVRDKDSIKWSVNKCR